ncbi:MAG: HlyD family secretion protein, partial [Bacteroidetes bacterium]
MAKLIENPEEIKLTEREEILAIMGNPPGWILRWGITVIFFVVGALLLVSYLVEYADTIPAEVTLTTQNPPIPVVAKANGKITNLQVKDKD